MEIKVSGKDIQVLKQRVCDGLPRKENGRLAMHYKRVQAAVEQLINAQSRELKDGTYTVSVTINPNEISVSVSWA